MRFTKRRSRSLPNLKRLPSIKKFKGDDVLHSFVEEIGEYLDLPDLLRVRQVCSSWNRLLAPSIFRTVYINLTLRSHENVQKLGHHFVFMHPLRKEAGSLDEWSQLLEKDNRFPKLKCLSSKVFSIEEVQILAEFYKTHPKAKHLRAFIAFEMFPLESLAGFENLTTLSLIEIEGCSNPLPLLHSISCPNIKKLFLVHQRPENINVKEIVKKFAQLDHLSSSCFIGSFEYSIYIDFKSNFISKLFTEVQEGQLIALDFKPPHPTPLKDPISRQALAERYHLLQALLKDPMKNKDILELVPNMRKATVSMYTIPPELPLFFSWLSEVDDLEFAILSSSGLFTQTLAFKATKLRLFLSDFPPIAGGSWIQKNFPNLETLEFPDLHDILWPESPPNFKHIICLNAAKEEALRHFLDRSKSCDHVSLPRYNFQEHKANGTFGKFPGVNFNPLKSGCLVFEFPYMK